MQQTYAFTSREITIEVATDGRTIDAFELSHFLYLYVATYNLACDELRDINESGLNEIGLAQIISERVRSRAHGLDSFALTRTAWEASDLPLGIENISRRNPLDIVLVGIPVALAVAVILSGGEFSVPGVKVKLPPLGEGIAKLREAFGRKPLRRKKVAVKAKSSSK